MTGCLSLWLCALSFVQAPLSERNAMSAPAATIFKSMLRYARGGDLDRLKRSLGLLTPVFDQHQSAFGADGVAALAIRLGSDDSETAAHAVEELILRDVVILVRNIASATPTQGRSLVLTAAVEWRLVEDVAAGVDFRAGQSVSARLRDFRLAQEDGATEDFPRLARELEEDLLRLATGISQL